MDDLIRQPTTKPIYVLAANRQHYDYCCRYSLGLNPNDPKQVRYIASLHSILGVDGRYVSFYEYETAYQRKDYIELRDQIEIIESSAKQNAVTVSVSIDVRTEIRKGGK